MPSNRQAVLNSSSQTITTTTETVVATSTTNVENNPAVGASTIVRGTINITAGTGTTAIVVRVREASLTGTLVGNAITISVTAGSLYQIPFEVVDASAYGTVNTTGAVWVATVQQTGASGNGTVNQTTVETQAATIQA